MNLIGGLCLKLKLLLVSLLILLSSAWLPPLVCCCPYTTCSISSPVSLLSHLTWISKEFLSSDEVRSPSCSLLELPEVPAWNSDEPELEVELELELVEACLASALAMLLASSIATPHWAMAPVSLLNISSFGGSSSCRCCCWRLLCCTEKPNCCLILCCAVEILAPGSVLDRRGRGRGRGGKIERLRLVVYQ